MQPNPSQDPYGQRNPYGHGPNYAPGMQAGARPSPELASGVEQFMTRVNAWMAAGVGLTGLTAFLVAQSPTLVNAIFGTGLFWVAVLAPVILVFVIASRVQKMSPAAATATFLVYSALNGMSLAFIFFVYSLGTIASVFAITAVTYGSLALWGFATKRDLSGWGRFLFMALVGLIVSSIAFMFIPGVMGSTMYLVYNVIGVLVFAALTAYDTQKIKQIYLVNGGGGNLAILGALTLYLDFINLFMFLLRLFGGGRD
ncbi:hypothetical protein PPSIR1_01924 [Plesiocystis pacifica SIR-1]|uniref:Integral membrane protein n=1 Tax=Plesiocystis pacifica SIR-1 TaxID=391625 RepID=A6G897_9BACT|nr:Bax inhibitor-1/YccA family protein [Plesiocystis pacifica]EDM77938.1 hypothetical protein PPSIR1_01924 [Plesiocystis pacifica SIR-1]